LPAVGFARGQHERQEMMEHALEPTADPAWTLATEGYDPLRESSLESRFAISNGFLGVRGARATTLGGRWIVPAHAYVAGLFDTPDNEYATPQLVPAAGWVRLKLLLPSGPLVFKPANSVKTTCTCDRRNQLGRAPCDDFKHERIVASTLAAFFTASTSTDRQPQPAGLHHNL